MKAGSSTGPWGVWKVERRAAQWASVWWRSKWKGIQ
jgi:hypothetical protein